VPCGLTSEQLPIGLQFQAAPLAEAKLLQAAHHYQTLTDWHQQTPPGT
jgi:aspartyl-tRNA(Asn)/glutamyl-tRNA(Gln) amidotransferase subunit A